MRILPPKTKKKKFTYKEFKIYFSNHIVTDGQKSMPVIPFWDAARKEYGFEKAKEMFLEMWPYEYQYYVEYIISELRDHNE